MAEAWDIWSLTTPAVPSGTLSWYFVSRTGVVQRRSSGLSAWISSIDESVHSATRRRSTGRGSVTLSKAAGASASKSKPYCDGLRAMTIAARIIGTYSRVSRGRIFDLSVSVQKFSTRAVFGARCTRPAVVGGQREVPVAAEDFAQSAEILRRGHRRLFRVGALIDVPVATQTVLE